MLHDDLAKLFNQHAVEQAQLLANKGADYANEDALSNFKIVGEMLNMPPEKVALVMIAIKVVRLANLVDKDSVRNEPLEDTAVDLGNYSFLFKALLTEQYE